MQACDLRTVHRQGRTEAKVTDSQTEKETSSTKNVKLSKANTQEDRTNNQAAKQGHTNAHILSFSRSYSHSCSLSFSFSFSFLLLFGNERDGRHAIEQRHMQVAFPPARCQQLHWQYYDFSVISGHARSSACVCSFRFNITPGP